MKGYAFQHTRVNAYIVQCRYKIVQGFSFVIKKVGKFIFIYNVLPPVKLSSFPVKL